MGKRILTSLLLLALASMPLWAVKARPGLLRHVQPDGKVVTYRIIGDERGHYIVDTKGCALAFGPGGTTLYYATYDERGVLSRSEVPASSSVASPQLLSAARNIPSGKILGRGMRTQMLSEPVPALRSRSATPNTVRTIVIPVAFSDLGFKNDVSSLYNLLMQTGYSVSGAAGCVKDYLDCQFDGQAVFVFDVAPVVTLSNDCAWYAKTDARNAEAVMEACCLSDAAVDFSLYDHVYVIYAGGNPADGGTGSDHIWPHAWDFRSAGFAPLTLDGVQVNRYAMSSELMKNSSGARILSGIGTICHEFSHLLGLPDLYDTDEEKSGGKSDALWRCLSLMDAGNYNDDTRMPPMYGAIELEILGLVDCEPLKTRSYTLEPISSGTRRVLRMEADVEGEYFLFECRTNSNWDKFIGGSGLLIYHIDRSERNAGFSEKNGFVLTAAQRWSPQYSEINCRPDHQCADLVEATAGASLDASSVTDVFFPRGNVTSFSPSTNPSFSFWSGEKSPYSILNIKKEGSAVTFLVSGPITPDDIDVFQDAAIITWHTDVESLGERPCSIRLSTLQGVVFQKSVDPYQAGCYSATFEGLNPGAAYSIDIFYPGESSGEELYKFSVEIVTSQYGGLPYIYMKSYARRSSATGESKLPLRVINARGSRSVSWYFNDSEIYTGPDGYFVPSHSGDLKARIVYSDGTEEIILRHIDVK